MSDEVVMVVTHDWDLFGAKKAGLRTAYVKHKKDLYNSYYPKPGVSCYKLIDLVENILVL